MYILNLEDNIFKHNDICKVIKRGPFNDVKIDCIGNLKDGIRKIEDMIKQGNPYDLIITDMWYPEKPGGDDSDSGKILIQKAQDHGWKIPIILCSSVRYCFPEITGSIYYSKNEDWETKLINLIKGIK